MAGGARRDLQIPQGPDRGLVVVRYFRPEAAIAIAGRLPIETRTAIHGTQCR
jgi:hypothetical protein